MDPERSADGHHVVIGGRRVHATGPELSDALEQEILTLLERRDATATICPSEVARSVGGNDWRTLMEPVRAAARRLVAAGDVVVTQRGEVVDPETATGPVRIRRAV